MEPITATTVQQLLEDRGWTPTDLMRRLELSPGTVNHWLSGRRSPRGKYLREMHRLIAETALLKSGTRSVSQEELQVMITQIVAAITPEDNEETTPLQAAYNAGARETARLIVEPIIQNLYANQDRAWPPPEAKKPQAKETKQQ